MKASTFEKLNRSIRDLYEPGSPGELRPRAVRLIREFIPADIGRYAELKPGGDSFENEYCTSRREEFERFRPFFNAHIDEQPVVSYYRRHRQGRVLRISDLMPDRVFARTNIYNEFYRRIGIRHQLTTALFSEDGRCREVILDREKDDFTRSDVRLLDLFTPHLDQAFANASRLGLLERENTRLRHSLEATGEGFLLTDSRGRILFATERAKALLELSGEADRHNPGRLPETLKAYLDRMVFREMNPLSEARGESRLVLHHPAGRIVVRYASLPPDASGRPEYLLILKESSVAPSARPLRSLGLTKRQTEILHLIATGQTDGEIAGVLGISRRTVEKHLEHIYQALGVSNRVEASRRALEVLFAGCR